MMLKNITTTAAHAGVQQGVQKMSVLLHHRRRCQTSVFFSKWARGTMKGSSIILTVMFIIVGIIFMMAILSPHQVQGFSVLPDFPRSPAFGFPHPPPFPEKSIGELFMQCGQEVFLDSFYKEMTYAVKDFYRCDISQFWMDKARRDGVHFPLDQRVRDEMHNNTYENGMHKEFETYMFGNKLPSGLRIFQKTKNVERNSDGSTQYDDYLNRQNGNEMQMMFQGNDIVNMYGNDVREQENDIYGHHVYGNGKQRQYDAERYGNAVQRGDLTKELEYCRRAERAEYCLAGDMMVSCMSRRGQMIARERRERGGEESFEEGKRFLGNLQEYLEKSLCMRYGRETLQCGVPMQQLGFGQWPVNSLTNKGRFTLGGCRSILKSEGRDEETMG